jgi:hypothetical protein
MSYDNAVASYKAEYARRYQELMHGTTGREGASEQGSKKTVDSDSGPGF